MAVSKPLLLLDNASMLTLLHQGCFRLQEISFEEVKAIIEMHGSREVVRCFSNAEIEQLLYKHLDVAIRNFNYAPVENMAVDQDAMRSAFMSRRRRRSPVSARSTAMRQQRSRTFMCTASFSHGSTPMRGHPLNKVPAGAGAFSKAPALFFGGKSAAGKTKIFDGGIDNRLCVLYS